MANETLLGILNETLREESLRLKGKDTELLRLRQELATLSDILERAKDEEARANFEYEAVFTKYRELLAESNRLPAKPYPIAEKIGQLSAEQVRLHDQRLAAKESVAKYQQQVRAAELALAMEEANYKLMQSNCAELSWQIKKLGGVRS
jgi:hypothetical protein